MSDVAVSADGVVSVEQDGRVLSGVGVTEESLHEVMDRHAPEEKPVQSEQQRTAPVAEASPQPAAEEKPSRGRQRFSDLTRDRDAANQKAEAAETARQAAERERDELKARLAQPQPQTQPISSNQSQTQPNATNQPQVPPPQPTYTRPKPSVDEIGTKYETYEDFIFDGQQWVNEQFAATQLDQRIRQSLDADRASRTFTETVEKTRAKGREVYADFDQVLKTGPGVQVMMSMDRIRAIIEHPQSEHVQYAIMRDGALAQRLAQADPIAFGMELAKLAPSQPAHQPASQPRPPAPFVPVGASSKTTVTPSSELAKGFDFDKSGYRARRAAERGVKPRF